MTYCAILNEAAGGGRCRKQAHRALCELRRAGLELDIQVTKGPGHATALARHAVEDGFTRFLSLGGDGTAFEVLNGLFPRVGSAPIALGMLPLGTGNSFLRDFGIFTVEHAIQTLLRDRRSPCDIMCVEYEGGTFYYMNLLSIGFSAQVGALTNKHFKKLGAPGYVIAVLLSIAKLQTSTTLVRLDGERSSDRRPSVLFSFSNSRYTGGGMMMAPLADLSDGELDIIRVAPMGRLRLLAAFPKIFRGTHLELSGVEHKRARRVDFDEVQVQDVNVDGEMCSIALKSISVLPHALQIIA